MADIVLNDEDILLPFTEETPVHADFMNPIIENVNKNTTRSKENSSAIGQIANDRGYLNSKSLGSDINLDTFFIQGRYYSSTCLGRPNADAFIIDVSGVTSANSAIVQKATCYYGAGNVNFGRTYERTYYQASGGWTPWKEVATDVNTLVVKNVPAGVTKIENLPMGIYHIYGGSAYFTDYPPLAKKMSHEYGILRVVSDGANYKTYSFIGTDANGTHSAEYSGFSSIGGGTTAIKWSGPIPYSVNAGAGITITAQNSHILNGAMYMNLTVRKTDNSEFATGAQYGIVGCPGLILTYPKNVIFTGWNSAGSGYISAGGVGTLFLDGVLYVRPTSACSILRVTGEFLIE